MTSRSRLWPDCRTKVEHEWVDLIKARLLPSSGRTGLQCSANEGKGLLHAVLVQPQRVLHAHEQSLSNFHSQTWHHARSSNSPRNKMHGDHAGKHLTHPASCLDSTSALEGHHSSTRSRDATDRMWYRKTVMLSTCHAHQIIASALHILHSDDIQRLAWIGTWAGEKPEWAWGDCRAGGERE
jgi:hypothetical protein